MRGSQPIVVRGVVRGGVCAAAVLPLLVALACACRVDRTKLESSIAGEAAQRGWPVRSVACPAGASARTGSRFECTLRFDDEQSITVAVTVLDLQGNVRWETEGGRVFDMDEVRRGMADKIGAALGHPVTVTCPKLAKVGVFARGDRFACEAEGAGAKLVIDARVKDDAGDYEYDWKGE